MYELNQKVGSLKIVGIIKEEMFRLSSYNQMPDKLYELRYINWTINFPGWKEKPLYLVKFDKPERQMTFEEFIQDTFNIEPDSLENQRKKYEKEIPYQEYATMPEDRLKFYYDR